MVTAINRWYALLPLKNISKQWSTKMTIVGCVFIFVLPVFTTGFILNPSAEFIYNFTELQKIHFVDEHYSDALGIANLGVYATNAGIICVFTLLAVWRYVQMIREKIKMSFSQKHEVKLLGKTCDKN